MHRMRPVTIAAALLAVVLTGSACGVLADTTAATVAGRSVSIESVEQLTRDEAFVGSGVAGITDSSLPGDLFRSVLQFELQRVAWLAEADRWGAEITDEIRQAAADEVDAQIEASGLEYQPATRDKIEEYVAAQTAMQTRMSRLDPNSDEDLRLLYDGAPSTWDRVCVAVVQLLPEQAGEATEALEAGTPVEELPDVVEGAQLAADPAQRCVPDQQLPTELREAFEQAEPGQAEGPVTVGDPTMGGATFVYRVDGRRTLNFEEARDELGQIAATLTQQGPQAWIGLVVGGAEVDSRFGSEIVLDGSGQATIAPPPMPVVPRSDLLDPTGAGIGATP